jgi:hypothetical protein
MTISRLKKWALAAPVILAASSYAAAQTRPRDTLLNPLMTEGVIDSCFRRAFTDLSYHSLQVVYAPPAGGVPTISCHVDANNAVIVAKSDDGSLSII